MDTWGLCLTFYEKFIFIGTDNHKIKVYDEHLSLIDELEGHEDGVCHIEFAGDMVYSASYD